MTTVAAFCVALCLAGTARGAELGEPLLRNFSPIEYGAEMQNWVSVEDHRGVIYVGNNVSVLEYDGARWRRIPTDNETMVRALAVGNNGRVYVGGAGEIGYLAPDASGVMHYVSLLERVPEQDRDFGTVWDIFVSPKGVYFSTFKRLIRISDHEVRVWQSPNNNFRKFFGVGGKLYMREAGRGLLQLRNDELVLVPGSERFADEKIYALLPWQDGSGTRNGNVLIGTRTQGWLLYDGARFTPWVTEVDADIKAADLCAAIWLGNGTLAAGTLRSGVFLLDTAGHLLAHIDKTIGLASNTVYGLLQDRWGGLWLSLDNGIARVEVSESLSYFGPRAGLEGGVYAIQRHAGTLYAGTTQGLYRLVSKPRERAHFDIVPGAPSQVWALLEFDGALLAAGPKGVVEIRDDSIQLVRASDQATTSLLRSRRAPNRVFIGTVNGIVSMRRQDDRWIDEGLVAATNCVIKMFQQADGQLWVSTDTDIVRLRFDDQESVGDGAAPHAEFFGIAQGLPAQPFIGSIADAAVFPTPRGIFRFDEPAGRFAPDPRFANLFADAPRTVAVMAEDARGHVWMYSNDDRRNLKESGAAVRDVKGNYGWDPQPLRLIAGNRILSMHVEHDGMVWLGGEGVLYRHDPASPMDHRQPFTTLIRKVSARDDHLLFGGAGAMPIPKLEFDQNALRFEFSAPSIGNQPNRFQVFLQGVDRDWSPWSPETYRDYTSILEGNYRFRVRAMNAYDTVGREAFYDFQVLPPWYRTWLAYLCYLLLTAGSFASILLWRSAALRARNEELRQLVAIRTAALQGAHDALAEQSITDVLTGLRNRRYLTEHIESDIAAVRRAYHENAAAAAHTAGSHHDLLVLMVDLDHFKQVNDVYGHAAGDRVLQQFSRILQSICRETDTAVRWGGEEFLLLARATQAESGPVIAERLRSLTAAHTFLLDDGKTLRRTCSIGFASYPTLPSKPEHFSWEDAVKLADQCLYEAKHASRNAWVGVQATAKKTNTEDPALDAAELETLVNSGYLSKHTSIRQIGDRAAVRASSAAPTTCGCD